jgi:hypothetical protein
MAWICGTDKSVPFLLSERREAMPFLPGSGPGNRAPSRASRATPRSHKGRKRGPRHKNGPPATRYLRSGLPRRQEAWLRGENSI